MREGGASAQLARPVSSITRVPGRKPLRRPARQAQNDLLLARHLDVPGQPERFQQPDEEKSKIELEPAKAERGRIREGVVVVVPALAPGQQAITAELRLLSSRVTKRRAPNMCSTELMADIDCSTTNMRTTPPQRKPVSAPHRLCVAQAADQLPAASRPSATQV